MKTTDFAVRPAPHRRPPRTVQRVMAEVLLALLPCLAVHVWFFGPGVLVQASIAIAAGLAFEAVMLRLRGQPGSPFLTDLSVPVTALLYVLCLPPLMPWWTTVVGMLFAIVIAKHLYGGLGHNVFNPAMVGYVAVLVSFPREATAWLPPLSEATVTLSFAETLETILTGALPTTLSWDAVTAATRLDLVRSGMGDLGNPAVFGALGSQGFEAIAAAALIGGAWLLVRRIISWHVPITLLLTVVLVTGVLFLLDPSSNPSPLAHLFSGGLMLGAFFIATDPVSGSTTPGGRIVFALGVAILTLVIRRWGGYPDGVAFAVLLMNTAVPLIDRKFRPRVYGHPR